MSLAEGRNVIRDIAESTMKKPSRRRRTKAARFLGESSSASAGSNPQNPETNMFPASDGNEVPAEPDTNLTEADNTENTSHPDNALDDLDLDDWEIDITNT
jgi:hypothetical protein